MGRDPTAWREGRKPARGRVPWRVVPLRRRAALVARQQLRTLIHDLTHAAVPRRQQAALRLRRYGRRAVAPLCEALYDPEPDVRTAAAASLGWLGDARAVPALTEVLCQSFDGGSGSYQGYSGVVMLAIGALLTAGSLGMGLRFHQTAALDLVGGTVLLSFWHHFVYKREYGATVCRAVAEALAQIAERDPVPGLRAALPHLQVVALDPLQQSRATRSSARRAVDRITDRVPQPGLLPIASQRPAVDGEVLPRPLRTAANGSDQFPRILD